MPKEIKSAQEATEIAQSFFKKHYFYVRPVKAVRQDDIWLIEMDVGPLVTKIAKIQIDAKSGDILEYTTPQQVS